MLDSKQTVLVTGGAGYIGSHVALELKHQGYTVIVLDNLSCGHRDLVENVLQVELIVGDIHDRPLLDRLFARYPITAVLHFAAHAYVAESMRDPGKYYRNNVAGTLTLLEAMQAAAIQQFVFSSTCATYGIPTTLPIPETHPQQPINPYGASKQMAEQLLHSFSEAYGLRSVIFRYFNAAGAHPNGQLGEDHASEPHLIPLILFTALGRRESITIFGTDYPTPDGTCIRDYIHVCDLAQAHRLGLEYLMQGGDSATFNLGNGQGFSIREVIAAAQQVTQRDIPVIESSRRPGDPPILVGSSQKASAILNWNPRYPQLSEILTHAWQWHQQRHGSPLIPITG